MEVWKEVPNYGGVYLVSNKGRVKSLKRKYVIKDRILRPSLDASGYPIVGLSKDKKSKTRNIHQLVAEAFLDHTPCGYDLVIDHIDDDKANNNLENLRVVTQRTNLLKRKVKRNGKYRGACYDKRAGMWLANIHFQGKRIHLGYFKKEIDASKAYEQKLKDIGHE